MTTRKTLKIIAWIAAAVALAISSYFLFVKKSVKVVTANTEKIVRETLTRKISATGTIKAIQSVDVGTQVSGTIAKLFVDFNNKVKAGQTIALMDTRNLIAAVKGSEAALTKAEVQLNQSKRALQRDSILIKKGTIAKVDLEDAEDNYQLALATYNSAKLDLERNLVNLDYATIKSPIDGIVVSRKVDVGQTVAASFSTPTFYVIANDLKKMKIEASVDEADIGYIKSGQQVEFAVDAFPDEVFTGVVKQVELQPITIQNVVTYIVEITIDNSNLKLMPGMTANIEIIVTKMENVLTIPNGALSFVMTDELVKEVEKRGFVVKHASSTKKKTIWLKQEKTFVEIPIDSGFSNGIKTEITGMMKEGDEVVNNIELSTGREKTSGSFFMPKAENNSDSKTP